jgi:hypothetical protein
VGHELAQVAVDSDREKCIVDALAKLMEVRMPVANAAPEHPRPAARGKDAEPFDGENERGDSDGPEAFAQRSDKICRCVAEETEREVELLRSRPRETGWRVHCRAQHGDDGCGGVDCDEESQRSGVGLRLV